MDFQSIKTLTIPEGEVTKIEFGGVVLWQAVTYKNWVKFSTEADGKTIYNNGLGYKDGWRVRSGGAEATNSYSSITGYIPYVKGDKLYIYPPFTGGNTDNTVNFYNSAFENLGQITDAGGGYGICGGDKAPLYKTQVINGVSVLDILNAPSIDAENIAYVRIGNHIKYDDAVINSGSEMIITKNEEIPL